MTFLTILIFSTAIAASIGVVVFNLSAALPRIAEVIDAEFAPVVRKDRQINFGAMKHHRVLHTADIVAFPLTVSVEREFKLAA